MATVKNFEDLEIWKVSRNLANQIYIDFSELSDWGFKNQITRAGVSIMNNISEGYSRVNDREFKHFLNIAAGSAGEVKSMYYLASDLNYISSETSLQRRELIQGLIHGISRLMKYLKDSNP